MYISGEHPGKGRYVCANCGKPLYLEDCSDTLPFCPECRKPYFMVG
jgi:DNA-directed RNA polymerase subunit RPC12/RpoP